MAARPNSHASGMFERRRTSGRFIRTSFSGAWSACLAVAIASPAVAHPHNRIGVEAVVMIEAGAVTALKYGWHFDRAYLEGLKDQYDKDHDSTISDEELQVWLANSIKTLDTFGSFTTLRLGREIGIEAG